MEVFRKIPGVENGSLSLKAFTDFIRNTFPGCDADPHFEKKVLMIFKRFSMSDPDVMVQTDFTKLYDYFLRRCMHPKCALIIVDFQNDFVDGSLSLKRCPRGENPEVLIPGLNKMVDLFDVVVYTYDWHPENHISFLECFKKRKLHSTCTEKASDVTPGTMLVFDVDGRPVKQQMWPRHCIQNTKGAELHKGLKVKPDSIIIHKGEEVDVDSYSAFWDNLRISKTSLVVDLRSKQVNHVYIAGIAYDACVLWTAMDAMSEGFMTTLIRDLTCSIANETTAEADARLKKANCPLISIFFSHFHLEMNVLRLKNERQTGTRI
ncbi:uncharacterized protein LOC111246833 isoform X2 [Varroa destructor]|uniref:nicotinamidase n=1 Tax=Varroa destructor TaxID=109461 RepID=A0A7M7JY74_VARDE|nr:uncharacterized protein LOC111246833 isoform X2 [Varroa destructor]